MKCIKAKGVEVVVYEPELHEHSFFNSTVEKNLQDFKESVDIIVANGMNRGLDDVSDKVYTRDVFGNDE